ncbi:hypothetical protein GGX14DRAFT_565299 [Mycena pura]|uniref:Uncharacterized protein n=1 Tax=Mycena pura TaxID=153505 RepID=A0AAD6VEI1_9AGAR|nr:hypothetical protein GGX14DRAFT_565299 [Mycena pura]
MSMRSSHLPAVCLLPVCPLNAVTPVCPQGHSHISTAPEQGCDHQLTGATRRACLPDCPQECPQVHKAVRKTAKPPDRPQSRSWRRKPCCSNARHTVAPPLSLSRTPVLVLPAPHPLLVIYLPPLPSPLPPATSCLPPPLRRRPRPPLRTHRKHGRRPAPGCVGVDEGVARTQAGEPPLWDHVAQAACALRSVSRLLLGGAGHYL